jgi:hypothetical protein
MLSLLVTTQIHVALFAFDFNLLMTLPASSIYFREQWSYRWAGLNMVGLASLP